MQPLRILIVEDDAVIALCFEMELKQAGYAVCQRASTGEAAIHIVQRDAPDVILMDIRLAGKIDGIETAKQIQASMDIPIIFMTGYPDKSVEERARALNPLGYFVKPVRVSTLEPLIASARKEAKSITAKG